MLHKGLVEELGSNTNTAGLLVSNGTIRVFPQFIPQRLPRSAAEQLPAVVFTTVSVDRQVVYCHTSGLIRSTLRLDSYADNYDGAKDLAAAVALALIDYRGLLGGIEDVRHAALESEFDIHDFEPGFFRVSQTWVFWHAETE